MQHLKTFTLAICLVGSAQVAAATTVAEQTRVTPAAQAQAVQLQTPAPVLSTRSAPPANSYAYAQPYGVGPHNDSR